MGKKEMKKLIFVFAILLTSCSSLQLEFATLNHVSNRARFTGFTQPQILNTDYFSINAPLTYGWFNNNNYGNSWAYFDFFQYNNYFWTPNQYWRYPANRWTFIDRAYNIPPVVRSTYVRPKVQPVPNIREPRRERTRIVNPNPIRRNYTPVRTQPSPQIRRQSTPTRTRTMNTQPDVQRRPVQTRPQTRVTSSEIKKVDNNKKQ
jgi:hypothetical protein